VSRITVWNHLVRDQYVTKHELNVDGQMLASMKGIPSGESEAHVDSIYFVSFDGAERVPLSAG
jgi:hypothetical protein